MSGYAGSHAELYDVFYAEKPYRDEAGFVNDVLLETSGGTAKRLLEIGCGTGGHALHLASDFDIVAIDASEELLRQARDKARRAGKSIDFRRQDMRALDLAGRFDAAIALFNIVGYLLTDDEMHAFLSGIRSHLQPGGLFVFDFWNPDAMLEHHDPVRIRRCHAANGEIVRISETAIDRERHHVSVAYTIFDPLTDGHYRRYDETQVNRYFAVEEIEAMLRRNGFAPPRFYSDFSLHAPITAETWRIVAVARSTDG